MNYPAELQKQARAELLELLKPGTTVYTICRHVSKSGMMRVIDLYVLDLDSTGAPYPRRITWNACKAAGFRYSKRHDGMQVSGCGMDMGFHAVYCLGQALWPAGTPEPHGRRNGEPDSSGGYALKQSWL